MLRIVTAVISAEHRRRSSG